MINHGYISSMAIFQIHSVVLLVPTIAENETKIWKYSKSP